MTVRRLVFWMLMIGTLVQAGSGVGFGAGQFNVHRGLGDRAARPAGAVPPAGSSNPAPISSDPFGPPIAGEHATEVEPSSFSHGDTLVTAFQVGRHAAGGSTAIGWATLRAGHWQQGILPALTTSQTPAGPYSIVSDPSVAYSPVRRLWLISALAVTFNSEGKPTRTSILIVRSTDGIHWQGSRGGFDLIADSTIVFYDKDWISCDTGKQSPYYGRCYATWDRAGRTDHILMSTSMNGGFTWSGPVQPAGAPAGLGGEPVAQPDGTVVVVASGEQPRKQAIIAFRSTDGGHAWSTAVPVATITRHTVAGKLRAPELPSVAVDGAGRIYALWQDCRFESACSANDLVLVSSTDGVTWSTPARIPLDPVDSGVDHFIPGLAASGAQTQLALTYYYYPHSRCTRQTCSLSVGMATSMDGGATWTVHAPVAGPFSLDWLAQTGGGAMVGDYITTSFLDGAAIGIYAAATAPAGGLLHERMEAVQF